MAPGTAALTSFAHDFSRIPLYAKAPIGLQRKLKVNTPGDIYEQEADRISEQVMSMTGPRLQRACLCGGCPACRSMQATRVQLQTARVQADNSALTEVPPIVNEVLRSPGQPLDPPTQEFMESRFGHDFSRVRVHTDTRAAASAGAVNALAYTVGRDVVFGAGQFVPGIAAGRKLLAHELTHTIQNQGGLSGKIQRKIIIGGAAYTPTEEDYANYDRGLLDRMHNGGKEPDYSFATDKEFQHEVGIRTSAMKTVVDVIYKNKAFLHFGFYNYEEGEFLLPEKYWEKIKRKEYHMKQGTIGGKPITPADAVESIFNGQNQTYLDCGMMLVAIQYKAMLDAYDVERFNQMFPGGKNLIIGQLQRDNPETPQKEGYQSTESGSHPLFDRKLYEETPVAEGEDVLPILLPGDWVYFDNAPVYSEFLDAYNGILKAKRPDKYKEYVHIAEWQGEHAVYLGDKKIQVSDKGKKTGDKIVQEFAGLGLKDVHTYEDMLYMMTSACKYEYKSMKLAEESELTDDALDDLSNKANDISDVPASVITGRPRISLIFRPKTKNIESFGK